MLRKRVLVLAVISCLLVLLAESCVESSPAPTPAPVEEFSQQESQNLAEDFVKNSPTFSFDGMAETLRLAEIVTLKCPYCWQFIFEFDSRHAGYGDREGQMLAQVITPHKAIITVDRGEIKSAMLDEKWDMINQRML